LHARRCGWLSAQTLGMYLLEQGREHRVQYLPARVASVLVKGEHMRAVRLHNGVEIATETLILASGPFLKRTGRLLGLDLPVTCELHSKVSFRDHARLFPSDAPLLISSDPLSINWPAEIRDDLAASEEARRLLAPFPAGVHARPENATFLALWAHDNRPVDPTFPIAIDPIYPELVLRGLATMLPALAAYADHPPKPVVDGGYYVKTPENRPLVGPLPVHGAYVIGALSGYGIMASPAAGELVAAQVTGSDLPSYATAFDPGRYADPLYRARMASWDDSGQL
jgi:sarcosine oxidase, subunit beta